MSSERVRARTNDLPSRATSAIEKRGIRRPRLGRLLGRIVAMIGLSMTASFAMCSAAFASNYHVLWEYDLNFYNSYAQVQTNQLADNYYNDYTSFTTDEMWRNDGPSDSFWQEIGYMVGNLNNSDFEGIFGAYEEGGYVEFAIQPNPPSGQQAVWFGANGNSVDYYYNGSKVATVGTSYGYSNGVQVGMESNGGNYEFNSFASGLVICSEQVYSGGSSYTYWPRSSTALTYYNDSPNVTSSWGYTLRGVPAANFFD